MVMIASIVAVLPVYAASAPSYIPLIISESSGTARSNLALTATIDNTQLQTLIYIDANALDTAVTPSIGAVTPLAHMVVNDRTNFFVPAVGANSQVTQSYQLGYEPPLAEMEIVAGNGGYVTVADNAAMEPGSGEWSVTMDGYFDTAAAQVGTSPWIKQGAVGLVVSSAGNITGSVMDAATTTTQAPNSDVIEATWEEFSGCTITTQFTCIDADDAAFMRVVNIGGVSSALSSFGIVNPGLANTSQILQVEVLIDYRCSGTCTGPGASVRPGLTLLGVTVDGTIDSSTSLTDVTSTQVIARPGGGPWRITDLPALQLRIFAQNTAAGTTDTMVDFARVRVTYADAVASVSAPVSAGEHVIVLGTDATNLYLTVDAVAPVTVAKATVQNTALNWFLPASSAAMPYANDIVVTIGGVQELFFDPITIITGTALPDRSGQGHNGVFTYGSSPTGITVTVGNLTVSAPSQASGAPVEPLYGGITGTPVPPGGLFFPTPSTNIPLLPILVDTNNPNFVPIEGLYLVLTIGTTMALGYFLWRVTRHPIPMCVGMLSLLTVWGVMGLFPLLFLFPIAAVCFGTALAMARA